MSLVALALALRLSPTTEPKQGMELAGRQLKINHPTGYRPSDPRASATAPPPSVPLRAPTEILQQYRVPTLSSSSRLPERQSVLTERQRRAERAAERKQRELFVGNLAAGVVRLPSASPRRSPSPRPRSPSATRPRDALEIPALTFRPPATCTHHLLAIHRYSPGQVTSQMLELLFSEPLRTIPGNEAHPVPPVVAARLDPGGRFAFVEFRDVAMAEVALHLFNGMMLCGLPMAVARPAGPCVRARAGQRIAPRMHRAPAHLPPPPRRPHAALACGPRTGPAPHEARGSLACLAYWCG